MLSSYFSQPCRRECPPRESFKLLGQEETTTSNREPLSAIPFRSSSSSSQSGPHLAARLESSLLLPPLLMSREGRLPHKIATHSKSARKKGDGRIFYPLPRLSPVFRLCHLLGHFTVQSLMAAFRQIAGVCQQTL